MAAYSSGLRKDYNANPRFMMSFRPDQEDIANLGASYVCQDLADRNARHSGNAGDKTKKRKFAIWGDKGYNDQIRDELIRTIEQMCGVKITDVADSASDAAAASRFQNNGVTTVLVRVGRQSLSAITSLASQQGWFPEWVLPGVTEVRGNDTNFTARQANQAQWTNAFGVTVDYRRDHYTEQPWYRAYKEGCPDCPDFTSGQSGGSSAWAAYDMLALLFYGIQSAGPKLTPENMDKGLHAIASDRSANPYKPAAYFAPGNYTFVKDAARIWWDPAATPPGSGTPGCYKLSGGGSRFRSSEFGPNDDQVKADGPCQGDAFQ